MQDYFLSLHEDTQRCYDIGGKARAKGMDPKDEIEIPQAADLAARVEQLVGPPGIAKEIRELSSEMGREELSLQIAKRIASLGRWKSKEEALDQAVRTGLAILTEGVLVAPLEGVAKVKIGRNSDGSEYVSLFFAGPIRSAGGTGQALTVLIADVVRRELGLDKYKPFKAEVERYQEEVPIYRQIMHLQYDPSPEEIALITANCPVCIDGEGTEKEEVAGHRDMKRVETNRVRGGACLVLAEGMCLKAKKIQKHVHNLGIKGWEFLDEFIKKPNGSNISEEKEDREVGEKFIPECKDAIDGPQVIENGARNTSRTKVIPDPTIGISSCLPPETKYIKDLIAGRPVLAYPSRKGGFRLRYGRARTTGLAALAINSATMVVADDFLAVGTQLKIERPGKAGVVTPCDDIEGPIVVLKNGDMIQLNSIEEAKEKKGLIDHIVDMGEMLLPYGEFVENNHPLIPGAYTIDWWEKEVKKTIAPDTIPQDLKGILEGGETPDAQTAIQISRDYHVPLHPHYNLFWHDIEVDELGKLIEAIKGGARLEGDSLVLPNESQIKEILIKLGALHRVENNEIVLTRYAYPVLAACGFDMKLEQRMGLGDLDIPPAQNGNGGALTQSVVATLAGFKIRPRAPIRIGARMGRPEKANERKMSPMVHVLFPIGQRGGSQRLIKEAAKKGSVEVEASVRKCRACGRDTPLQPCICGGSTESVAPPCIQTIQLGELLTKAQTNLGGAKVPDLKGVIGLISEAKTPEPLEKGILRARHGVSVFKDGTVRFDMTDVPLTHFRPYEIGTSVEKLKYLGYTKDVKGRPLEHDGQLLELKVQDLVPSLSCGEYFVKCASFLDDLLGLYYELPRFYHASAPSDLVGQLVVGLAPHTSGGVLGRIIGYTSAKVGYAHPFYHAAKRRNCDGDEDCLMLLLDGLLNFSRSYLPSTRGGLMDAPLILTTRIDPNEIDKEAHNVDAGGDYPLEFYEAAAMGKPAGDVKKIMDLVGDRIGTPSQYEDLGFTYDTPDIGAGPKESAYKTLGTMIEKMEAQLALAKKISAVDEADVASKVICTHFLPDMLGNLKSFSRQKVRCTKCNKKYRRIPLCGKCIAKSRSNNDVCGGDLTLTVHEGGVKKYLDITKKVAKRYNVSKYTQQRIMLAEKAISSLFDNDRLKKCTLEDFL